MSRETRHRVVGHDLETFCGEIGRDVSVRDVGRRPRLEKGPEKADAELLDEQDGRIRHAENGRHDGEAARRRGRGDDGLQRIRGGLEELRAERWRGNRHRRRDRGGPRAWRRDDGRYYRRHSGPPLRFAAALVTLVGRVIPASVRSATT